MKNLIRSILKKVVLSIKFFKYLNLKSRNFTIISDNCWGGFVYQDFNIPYKTPFVGLNIFSPCYLNLLEDFEEHISADLTFIDFNTSKYYHLLKEWKFLPYPIGLLKNSVEIHFLHYKTIEEAKLKWDNRKKRINRDKMLIKFCDRDLCTEALIKRFDELPFKNKVCFTAKPYNYASVVWLKEFEGLDMVEYEWNYYKKNFNIIRVLNNL